MKLCIIYCVVLFGTLALACDFQFKEDASESIKLSHTGNNFLTAELLFPRLDLVFDCIQFGDKVNIEVLYGLNGVKAEHLTAFDLTFKGNHEQVKKILDTRDRSKVEACTEYKIVLKPKWNGKKGKALKFKNFQMGPDLVKDIKVENITSTSALITWQGDECDSHSAGFVLSSASASAISVARSSLPFQVTGLRPCYENDVTIYPSFGNEFGIATKEGIKTFPDESMIKVRQIAPEIIEIDPIEVKDCSFQRVDYIMSFKATLDGGEVETSFKENLQPHDLVVESVTSEEVEKKMTHLKMIKTCTSFTMSLTMKFQRGDNVFLLPLVTNQPITTDADRKVHMTEENMCNRNGRQLGEEEEKGADERLDDIERALLPDPPSEPVRLINDTRLALDESSIENHEDFPQQKNMGIPTNLILRKQEELHQDNETIEETQQMDMLGIVIAVIGGVSFIALILGMILLVKLRRKNPSEAAPVSNSYNYNDDTELPRFMEKEKQGQNHDFMIPEK